MFRIVHTADWHWEADKIDKCQESANFILHELRGLKPDLIAIAGDLQNRRQYLAGSSAVLPMMKHVIKLAECAPVVIIYGNESHDPSGSLDFLTSLSTRYPIHLASRAETIVLHQGDDRVWFQSLRGTAAIAKVILHLMPYPTKQWFLAGKESLSIDESNLLIQDAIKKIFTGFGAISMDAKCPVVLVGHGNISGSKLCSGQDLVSQDIMLSKHDLELARTDVQCWGHIHECQEVAPSVWYSGSTFHNNWGEVTPRYLLLHEIERGSCQTTKIQIPSRALALHEVAIVPGPALELISGPGGPCDDADVRIRVHGTKEQQLLMTDEQIEACYPGAHSYKVERITTPTERVRSSDVTKVKTLPEKLTAWSQVTDQKLSPEVLALAGEVERTVSL